MCGSMVDIQSVTAEIRREKKKEQDENIYVRILLCRADVNNLPPPKYHDLPLFGSSCCLLLSFLSRDWF